MGIYDWVNNEFIDPLVSIIKSKNSFNNSPIILHQMGKVASKSIHYSLDKYEIYINDYAEVLLLKFEKLNECINQAMNDFLNIDSFRLHRRHLSKNKKYEDIYAGFLESIILEESLIDKYYSSDYITHFYKKEELDSFRKKWIKKNKDIGWGK